MNIQIGETRIYHALSEDYAIRAIDFDGSRVLCEEVGGIDRFWVTFRVWTECSVTE